MQHRVIYHPESLIPRSLAFNVTTDVLGAAINILETNLRMEDLEVVFKRLFGAEGFFPSNQFEDLFNVPPEEESNDVKTTNRLKRSVNNIVDLKTIDQKVSMRNKNLKSNLNSDKLLLLNSIYISKFYIQSHFNLNVTRFNMKGGQIGPPNLINFNSKM